jgi:hypothetical protein
MLRECYRNVFARWAEELQLPRRRQELPPRAAEVGAVDGQPRSPLRPLGRHRRSRRPTPWRRLWQSQRSQPPGQSARAPRAAGVRCGVMLTRGRRAAPRYNPPPIDAISGAPKLRRHRCVPTGDRLAQAAATGRPPCRTSLPTLTATRARSTTPIRTVRGGVLDCPSPLARSLTPRLRSVVVIYDKWPKAKFHLLCMPALPPGCVLSGPSALGCSCDPALRAAPCRSAVQHTSATRRAILRCCGT